MSARPVVTKRIAALAISLLLLAASVMPIFDVFGTASTESVQVFGVGVAGANPTLRERQEQARVVAAEVAELDRQLQLASDDYFEARQAYQAAIARRQEADDQLEKTQARLEVVQLHLNTRATEVYRNGTAGILEVLLGAASFEEFAGLWTLLENLNRSDAASSAELKDLRTEVTALRAELIEVESEAKLQNDRMLEARQRAERDLANRQARLRGIEAEVRQLQREQQEAERRAAAARAGSSTFLGGGQSFPTPTRAPRSEVVNIARRYLGRPYQWGGNGPHVFDCSGFTSYVYRQVGINLPRTSRQQIHAGQRVSRADIRPGDLVFFGNPIHHVGIYVGGGQMIHAPHAGDVVRYAPAFNSIFVGATRP
ncbi:MAG: NlpC/P60 family protein [Coriobacteriia bacterium]|nr:NlpC/P60 family protein [Coriobacteriia bacterium]